MRGPLRWAQASSLKSTSPLCEPLSSESRTGPLTLVRVARSTSPRAAGRGKETFVLATPMRPSFAHHHDALQKKTRSPAKRGRRSAERRMPTIAAQHQQTSPPADASGAAARHADKCTQSAHSSACGARPPSGASTAALARDFDIAGSASGHASWDSKSDGRYPPSPVPVQ